MSSFFCELCQIRPANVHMTQSLANQSQQLHACHICLNRLGITQESTPPPLSEIKQQAKNLGLGKSLGDDGGNTEKNEDQIEENLELEKHFSQLIKNINTETACPACGLNLQQFNAHKRFGCEHDYHHFGEHIAQLLESYHGSSQHSGRGPLQDPIPSTKASTKHMRKELESALQEAIAAEHYEQAAKLRDQIESLSDSQSGTRDTESNT